MLTCRKSILIALVLPLALALAAPLASAQAPKPGSSGTDRLFLGFAEEAAGVPGQWWEAQLEFRDGGPIDATILRGIVALKLFDRMEMGGRVGFGSTDAPHGGEDGSGATDLDLWAKWNLGNFDGATDVFAGGLVTVPTGDDTAGLGFDAFDIEGFAGIRHRLDTVILAGHAGLRVNGDGQIGGTELDGNTSVLIGGGVLFPLADQLTLVGETLIQSERYDDTDTDWRVLAGANWRPWNRGMLRGGISVGLTDGSADAQLFAGYAYVF